MRFSFRKSRLVLALGAGLAALLTTAGVSYTLWTQTLTINDVVNTGSMNIHFTGKTVNTGKDPYQGWDLGPNDNGTASCATTFSADLMTATTTITNGYPGFTCGVDYIETNEGTVRGVLTALSVAVSGPVPVSYGGYVWCNLYPGETIQNGVIVSIPTGVTDHMAETTTVTISFSYTNYYPGEVGYCGPVAPSADQAYAISS